MRTDKKTVERLIKTAKGQLDGILKMIEEDRYCIDISNQLLATEAILKKANNEVIKGHIKGCMMDAMQNGNEEEKIEELMCVIGRLG